VQLRRVSWTDRQLTQGRGVRDWSCIYVCTGWSIGRRQRRQKSPSSNPMHSLHLPHLLHLLHLLRSGSTSSATLRPSSSVSSAVKIRDPHQPPSRSAPDSLRLELDAGQYARADGSKRLKSPAGNPTANPTLTGHPLEQLPAGSARNTTF
jgi:hypothetical protein